MTVEEKDRLVETIIYLYFTAQDRKTIESVSFWKAIKEICETFSIDSISISKAARILLANENRPSDEETYWLLNNIGLTVRPIRTISGIYWQKQVKFKEDFEAGKKPIIKRRITDIVVKQNMRDFIGAIYKITGIFGNIDKEILDNTLFS